MYCLTEDIRNVLNADTLVYLVDDERERAITPAGEERIIGAIRAASSEADSYLGQRYSVPIQNAPEVLRTCVMDITVYRLFMRRGIRVGTADESVPVQYKNAIAWLKNVAENRAALAGVDGAGLATQASTGIGTTKISADDRVFNRETLKDF